MEGDPYTTGKSGSSIVGFDYVATKVAGSVAPRLFDDPYGW